MPEVQYKKQSTKKEYKHQPYSSEPKTIFIKNLEKKLTGHATYTIRNYISKENTLKFENLPRNYYDEQNNLKNFLYIDIINAFERKNGHGSEMMKMIIYDSLQSDSEGRILLIAENNANQGTPVGFYKKLGFKCCDPAIDKKVDMLMAKDENLNDYDIDNIGMYLPKEKASEYYRAMKINLIA